MADIERAVERLRPDDLAAFRSWFERFEANRFDRQVAEDAMAGRLDRFADEALDERRHGAMREM